MDGIAYLFNWGCLVVVGFQYISSPERSTGRSLGIYSMVANASFLRITGEMGGITPVIAAIKRLSNP
jgi:hypothetical protein